MARYNEILTGRFNRFMQKIFSMKGPASLVTLSDELSPAFLMFNGVENRYLESWSKFAITFNAAAGGAGNRAGVRFRNPAGSNIVMVIERLQLWSSGGAPLADTPIVQVETTTTDFPSASGFTKVRLDSRGAQSSVMVATAGGNVGGNLISAQEIFQTQTTTTIPFVEVILMEDHQIPLQPGDAITVFAGTLNQGIGTNFMWRERFLEESERT